MDESKAKEIAKLEEKKLHQKISRVVSNDDVEGLKRLHDKYTKEMCRWVHSNEMTFHYACFMDKREIIKFLMETDPSQIHVPQLKQPGTYAIHQAVMGYVLCNSFYCNN